MISLQASLRSVVFVGLTVLGVICGLSTSEIPRATAATPVNQEANVLLRKISDKSKLLESNQGYLLEQRLKLALISQVQQPILAMNTKGILTGGALIMLVVVTVGVALRERVVIGKSEVGIIYKKFAPLRGSSNYPIARNEEVGYQPNVLHPGWYFKYWSWMYDIRRVPPITISPEEVGLVEAKDGSPLSGQQFGKVVECKNFEDGEAFLRNGGQRGKQLAILTAGTYYINSELFSVRTVPITRVPADKVGLVEARDGKILSGQQFGKVVECKNFEDGEAFLRNGGQRGKQLAILTVGDYYINTDLFITRKVPVIRVPQGEIALVIANDGKARPRGQRLGRVIECDDFQNAKAFLEGGGQRGEQLAILTAGDYYINTDLFTIITTANATQFSVDPKDLQVYRVEAGKIGIVRTFDGAEITYGEISGSIVRDQDGTGHNNFQDGQKFIDLGGCKGLQEEVLLLGDYALNPWFVQVEQEPMIYIPDDAVGVVVSSIGKEAPKNAVSDHFNPNDLTEREYKLVQNHSRYRGIWREPLGSGQHPINTELLRVVIVPTSEIILEWSDDKTKSDENYDKTLAAIEWTSTDGYKFKVEMSLTICVKKEYAPKMVARLGSQISDISELISSNSSDTAKLRKYKSIRSLVTKVLTPKVRSGFYAAVQQFNALQFFRYYSDREGEVKEYLEKELEKYGVQVIDVSIEQANPPDELKPILTSQTEGQVLQAQLPIEAARARLVFARAWTETQQELAKFKQNVTIAELKALAEGYEAKARAFAISEEGREQATLQAAILQDLITLLGRDNVATERIMGQLTQLNLPDVWVNNSDGRGSGLLEAIFAPALRSLANTGSGMNSEQPAQINAWIAMMMNDRASQQQFDNQVDNLPLSELPAGQPAQSVKSEELTQDVSSQGSIICNSCKAENPLNLPHNFCSNCGASLVSSSQSDEIES
jgi:uncharacterized membrane protein YqiK